MHLRKHLIIILFPFFVLSFGSSSSEAKRPIHELTPTKTEQAPSAPLLEESISAPEPAPAPLLTASTRPKTVARTSKTPQEQTPEVVQMTPGPKKDSPSEKKWDQNIKLSQPTKKPVELSGPSESLNYEPLPRNSGNPLVIKSWEFGSPTAQPSTPAATPSAPPQPSDATVEELMRNRAETAERIKEFNKNNPLDVQGMPGQLDPEMIKKMEEQSNRLKSLLERPWIQAYLRILNDPRVFDRLVRILQHRHYWLCLGTDFILIFVVLFWRGLRSLHAETFAEKAFLNAGSLLLYALFAFVVVPGLYFGDLYLGIFKDIYLALQKK